MNSIFTNELKNKLYSLTKKAQEVIPESPETKELLEQVNSLLDKRITEVETGVIEPVSGINTELKESAILKDAPTLLRYLDENRISFNGLRLVSKEDDTSEEVKANYTQPNSPYKKININSINYYILPKYISEYLRYTISKIDNSTIASVFKVKVETILRNINDATGSNISFDKSQAELDLEKSIQEAIDIPLHLQNLTDPSKVKLHSSDLSSLDNFVKFLTEKKTELILQGLNIRTFTDAQKYAADNIGKVGAGVVIKYYIQYSLQWIQKYLKAILDQSVTSAEKKKYTDLIALTNQLLGQIGTGNYTEKSTSPSEASAFTSEDQVKSKALSELRTLPFTSNSFLDIKQAETFFKEAINYLTASKRTTELNVVTDNYNSFNNRLTSLRNARFSGNTLKVTNPENFLGLNNLNPNARVAAALNIFQLMVQDVVSTCDYIQTIAILKESEYIKNLNSNSVLGEQLVRSISSSFNVAQARKL
jgi:hypothetical protein